AGPRRRTRPPAPHGITPTCATAPPRWPPPWRAPARNRSRTCCAAPWPEAARRGSAAQRLGHERRQRLRAQVHFGAVVLRRERLGPRVGLAETEAAPALARHGAAPPAG